MFFLKLYDMWILKQLWFHCKMWCLICHSVHFHLPPDQKDALYCESFYTRNEAKVPLPTDALHQHAYWGPSLQGTLPVESPQQRNAPPWDTIRAKWTTAAIGNITLNHTTSDWNPISVWLPMAMIWIYLCWLYGTTMYTKWLKYNCEMVVPYWNGHQQSNSGDPRRQNHQGTQMYIFISWSLHDIG